LDVPAYRRLIIPEVVVVKIRLLIKILPRQPEIAGEVAQRRRILIRHIRPERIIIVPRPHRLPYVVGDEPGRVQVVRVYEM